MSYHSSLIDALNRIRNAVIRGHRKVVVPKSKLIKGVLSVLLDEGFIEAFNEIETGLAGTSLKNGFEVTLRYFRNQRSLINEIKAVSKPSRRVYSGYEDLPPVKRGLGIAVLSTNQGIISDRKAKRLRVGGEVLALVY
ncbi:MAG: 30S ribosomal protein S8 [Deltaproteobacteria bacterium]|nr:30S ribosomal protein S8 [Deltaproteobacteria bacterium]